IWRRFDDAIEFPLTHKQQLLELIKLKLRGISRQFELEDDEVLSLFIGKSGADLERIVRRAIKRMILRSQEFLTLKDLKNALLR
ncbi:AAA family ATPase, partial [Escherichia coli]